MSSRSAAASRLDPGLIARKGQAAPAGAVPPTPSPSAATAAAEPATATASGPAPRGLLGTIAVTVRLDPERYERLKVHGARARRTNQEILVQALDDYFRRMA